MVKYNSTREYKLHIVAKKNQMLTKMTSVMNAPNLIYIIYLLDNGKEWEIKWNKMLCSSLNFNSDCIFVMCNLILHAHTCNHDSCSGWLKRKTVYNIKTKATNLAYPINTRAYLTWNDLHETLILCVQVHICDLFFFHTLLKIE